MAFCSVSDETLSNDLGTEKWCHTSLTHSIVQGNFSLALTCQSTEDFIFTKTFCLAIPHRALNSVLLKAVIMQKYGLFPPPCPQRNITASEEAALLYKGNLAGLVA